MVRYRHLVPLIIKVELKLSFIDLAKQSALIRDELESSISRILDHGQYIMGQEVRELEERLASYVNVKHVLACSSGTDALVLPLMAKNLQKDSAIFTTPFTFFASAESISLAGGTPVFVDIDPDTYNLCPSNLTDAIEATHLEGKLNPKGIIPVDLFGIAADYGKINHVAQDHDLFVIEDAAQSFGARYGDQHAGALAEIAATSFYPAKPLGCYGDGGAVFTDDSALYEELVSLRVHGQATSGDKYDNVRIGLNARMDTIQAAILLEELEIYDQEQIERDRVAAAYTERLEGVVKTPVVPEGQSSVWAQYSVQSDSRDRIREALSKEGIPTAVFYPIPIHLSTAYKHLGYKKGDFPVAEAASERIFSLPMHPYLELDQIDLICDVIRKAV